MGCDIHFFVEKLSIETEYGGPIGKQRVRSIKLNEILDPPDVIKERWITCDTWTSEIKEDGVIYWECDGNFEPSRNYYLFGILANIRNWSGSVIPLDEPRGIPKSYSDGYSYQLKQWNGDAHSHSYFTLKELLEADWEKYDKDSISKFLQTIEDMKDLGTDYNKIRCVFFFDN